MGRHIFIELHLIDLAYEDILDSDVSKIIRMSDAQFAQHEKYHELAWSAYEKALEEIEQLDDIDALSDWTSFLHHGAVLSIALPKKAEMNKNLLELVESLRARGIIHGYSVYSSGA